MNSTEIYDALSDIAAQPFDAKEFPYAFAAATDLSNAAISKLRSSSGSDVEGAVLARNRFHFASASLGQAAHALAALKASKKGAKGKPAILIVTDGVEIAAEHPASGETLHCTLTELGDNYLFFLPAAGKERYKPAEENLVDVKATSKLARLYDALIRQNPEWKDARRHEMNQLMMRLIFCMFAEDVGIFEDDLFSRTIFTHAGPRGEEARTTIIDTFRAMNLAPEAREGLPHWTCVLPYVNGGLFAGPIDAPHFDVTAYRYLSEALRLDWREINPDIFGSMIQAVADPETRSELGMHYTSVPNIMKVIGPLFLDDLDAAIEAARDKPRDLRKLLTRLEGIRVFDPACGSGNFLVVSYRQLREREMRILGRLRDLEGPESLQMFSTLPINHFFGIDIADFAVETAKLALFIAEYQANAAFAEVFGRRPPALPLHEAAHIVVGNSLREDWQKICPPPREGEEVYIVGNPPFLGFNNRLKSHQEDMDFVLKGRLPSYHRLDYVICWFLKASDYIREYSAEAAFVATNSICQGSTVSILWPKVMDEGVAIKFSHQSFPWSNNASSSAAVICVIIGLTKNKMKIAQYMTASTRQNPATSMRI